ncbi:MAG TPA: septum formation initiator family protein [Bacteroidota bacterium]|nr:septum formation initiator family protein [Bacteroidota bacterium]
MDDQYYRKAKPKTVFPAWLRKFFKSTRVRLILLAGLPMLAFVLFGNKGVLEHLHLRKERSEMEFKILQAQKEQLQLQEQSKALDTDPKMIEKVARENYGMIKEGETVYKVKKEK